MHLLLQRYLVESLSKGPKFRCIARTLRQVMEKGTVKCFMDIKRYRWLPSRLPSSLEPCLNSTRTESSD